MTEGTGRSRRTKLERIIDEYDLQELESVLVERWTADSGERWSLRELATFVNQRVLEAALRDAGEQPLEGEIENHYRLLTSEDVSAGARTEARRELERAGIDVDALQSDFVSHQAVHTYLTDRQEVSFEPRSDEDRLARGAETIRRLENRTGTVAESTVEQLRDAGVLELGEFSVLTSVTFLCEECGRQLDLDDLLEEGGCDCRS